VDRALDFMGEVGVTALVCESDPTTRKKICQVFEELGYKITTPTTAKDALGAMRFHIFDIIVLNDHFDTEAGLPNLILQHLQEIPMSLRRRFVVVLVSNTYRTMDNMAALNRSVNMVIHTQNIDNMAAIIKRGVADHRAFYHVFQETLQKTGRM
jgi:CheY-like chemotaxis protein